MMGMWDDGSEADWSSEMYRRFILAVAMNNMQLHEDGMQGGGPGTRVRPSTWEEYRVLSASLSSLNSITIPELSLGKRHGGRVLYGKFCIEPLLSQSVNDVVTLLVDANANAIRVITSKLLWNTATKFQSHFSLGRRVAIKEPFIEMCSDGSYAVRVISPTQVISLDDVNGDDHSPEGLEELQKIRSEGNLLFAEQNWAAAVSSYSQCIDQALRKLDNNGSPETTNPEALNRILMLAYSNQAEARLRLQHHEDASSDADKALKIEPKHVKTLVRKGKAAHALGLFEKSCEAFKAALQESPQEQSIMKNLRASTTAHKQALTGQYDLSEFLLGKGEVPSCADFVGPVQICRAGSGQGGLGLFATRNVKAGEPLLVSNPLATVQQKYPIQSRFGTSRSVEFEGHMNLIAELANRIRTSKRQMAQLYSLSRCGKDESEIPSMELFNPGSEWVPKDLEKFEVDIDLISDITTLHTLGKIVTLQLIGGGDFVAKEVSEGLWALPSFANHSCAPNVVRTFVGDAIFFRASVDIVNGEELTISYLYECDLFEGLKARQDATKGWSLTCKCARCMLEESLKQKLSKINKKFSDLQNVSVAEYLETYQWRWSAAEDLAKVANAVEEVLQSEDSKLGSNEQGWIRASFLFAYLAKLHLARDKGDSESTISALRLILDSMTSVSIGSLALREAQTLLKEVDQRYSKHSQLYRLTLDRVLGVFTIYYGKLPKRTLHKLISGR